MHSSHLQESVGMHPRFKAGNRDIFVRSSDRVLFGLHRKNLETYAGAFPLEEAVYDHPVTTLTLKESSEVLEVVFEFLYPKRYPDLEDKEFETLILIADAVEKYKVFAAMHTCTARLKLFVSGHPRQIFVHAVKYGLESLLNEAASNLVFCCDPLEIAEELPSRAILSWLRYYRTVNIAIFQFARTFMESSSWTQPKRCSTTKPLRSLRDDDGDDDDDGGADLTLSCRNAFVAWIAYLEGISTRTAFEEEIESQAYFKEVIRVNCSSEPGMEWCFWLGHLARRCERGLEFADEIKFVPRFYSLG